MELEKINTFLRNHTNADFFEKDVELFKQKFPESKLIASLKNVMEIQKAQLDERICAELLLHKDACIDCIWENRGFYVNAQGFINPLTATTEKPQLTETQKQLLELDVENADYNEMKKLVFALGLNAGKGSKKDYINTLSLEKHNLQITNVANTAPTEATIVDNNTNTQTTEETPIVDNTTPIQEEKKSVDHE